MDKEYMKVQKYFAKNDITRIPHGTSAEIGPVTPCNCSHPCAYGRGKSFCFPCYQILLSGLRGSKIAVRKV